MENKELLYSLYKVYSPSRGEKKMRKFIKDYIKRNIPGVTLEYDSAANIYATKGHGESYPCVVSHIDQVQKKHNKDFKVIEIDGKCFGFSPCVMEMQGLGADDKNGIWVCLQCLAKYDNIKCAFFVGEEIGCVGSDAANMDFFNDCRFVLQCDRRNGGDLITSIWADLCSQEFLDDIDFADFGYHEEDGLTTDVGTLKDNGLKVSCVNMSCGYYEPHTDEEWTNLAELQNCLEFVEHIIEKCTRVYPHESVRRGWGMDDDDYFGYLYGGGYRSYGPKQPINYGSRGGLTWAWNDYKKCYENRYEDEDEGAATALSNAEEEQLRDDEWDDINSQIFDDCLNGLEDKDIITDIQFFFPHYDSELIQMMIDDVRKSFAFRQFS